MAKGNQNREAKGKEIVNGNASEGERAPKHTNNAGGQGMLRLEANNAARVEVSVRQPAGVEGHRGQ